MEDMTIKELVEELNNLVWSEIKDNVDTSLSTLEFRNKRISDIEQELTSRGVDLDLVYETQIDPCE